METFNEIINYIARTNLFNFVIFMAIIIFIGKKVDFSSKVEKMRADVENNIEESKVAKSDSEEHLHTIEDSISHIEEEIDAIIKTSEDNAKLIGDKILQDAEKTALVIQENSQKTLESSRNLLKKELIKRASAASVEIAKSHIINELNNNYDLHNKLIDESVDAIEGVDL